MNLRPILDKIIVKPDNPEKETSGGILLAKAENEGIVKGSIVAVGPGAYNEADKFVKPTVNVGDKIVFNFGAGSKIKHEEEEYVVITEKEVIAIFS